MAGGIDYAEHPDRTVPNEDSALRRSALYPFFAHLQLEPVDASIGAIGIPGTVMLHNGLRASVRVPGVTAVPIVGRSPAGRSTSVDRSAGLRAGGDDAIRPSFPAAPGELAPFGWPTYRLHQELIGLRRRHPWLLRAKSRVVELRNTDLVFEAFGEGNRLWVALNLADAAVVRTIESGVDRLAGSCAARTAGERTELTLPPYGWAILG